MDINLIRFPNPCIITIIVLYNYYYDFDIVPMDANKVYTECTSPAENY